MVEIAPRRKRWHVVLATVAMTVVVGGCDGNDMSGIPLAQRGVWIGAYVPPAPWESMNPVHDLERSIGRRLDLVHIYKAWGNPWGAYDSQTIQELTIATAENRRALITWEPWVQSDGVQQPGFSLSNIAKGAQDAYIRSWAYGLRDFPGVVYLRPIHEMNSDWYPWAGGIGGNTTTDYVAAWRHMHDIFSQANVQNVRWIWCPYALDVPTDNRFEAYYPGDGYVDILGLDAYNWGVTGGYSEHRSEQRWQNVDELISNPYDRLTKIGPQPVWLTEIASAERGGDKAGWLQTLLELPGYDRIRAVVWFDADKERDWRINSSAGAAASVARALAGTHPAVEEAVAYTPSRRR